MMPSRPSGGSGGEDDATRRFSELVARPDSSIPLDELMVAVAAHDHPVSYPDVSARLDALAADVAPDPAAVARHLFVEEGFRGNTTDYRDPANSFLDVALERRVGIPITLSVVMIEIGRRRGVPLDGVGMPGHFLVGSTDGALFDPFDGGRRIDVDGARRIFAALRGDVPFLDEYLAPVGPRSIAARVLANLLQSYVDRDPTSAVWVARLRLRIPGLSPAERRETAALLGSLGRFEEAAAELEQLVDLVDGEGAARLSRDAAALRARAN